MAVRALLAVSLVVVTLVALVLAATAAPRMDDVCKSTDARGNVTYRDCPPQTTYGQQPARRPSSVEEEESAPATASKSRESARTAAAPVAAQGMTARAIPRTTYPVAGIPLLLVGMIVALISGIQFLVQAFRVSLLWGLGCVFLSPVSPVFLVLHWNVAKRPFFVSLAGIAAALVGYALLGAGT